MLCRFCLFAGLVCHCLGCGEVPASPTSNTDTSGVEEDQGSFSSSEEGKQSTSGGMAYPELYTSAKLPQYVQAKLTDTGRQTTSLRDGLKLTLESSDAVQTIAKYYEDECGNREGTFLNRSFGWRRITLAVIQKGTRFSR